MQIYGQLNPGKAVPAFPTIIRSMVKNDGVASIYKGLDAAIGRQMVYGTGEINYGGYVGWDDRCGGRCDDR